MRRIAATWGDDDRYFGPFTFAKDKEFRQVAVVLSSTDDEDRPANFRLSAFGYTFLTVVPSWLVPPQRKKVHPTSWDPQTISRLGRDWYWDVTKREYGVSLWEGHLSIMYGRQTHDSRTNKRWGYFLPWTQWRIVRHDLYDLNGKLFANLPVRWRVGEASYDNFWYLNGVCPKQTFAFRDFDGEELTAATKIEEREWRLGEKWFKWVSVFTKPMIRRSLSIDFSGETGKRKGSWKGGTVGTGINMLPGELHEGAFKRYCAEHDMEFVGRI